MWDNFSTLPWGAGLQTGIPSIIIPRLDVFMYQGKMFHAKWEGFM